MRLLFPIIHLCMLLGIAACSGPRVYDLPKGERIALAMPSDFRAIYYSHDGRRFCAEPAPDTALDSVTKFVNRATGGRGFSDLPASSPAATGDEPPSQPSSSDTVGGQLQTSLDLQRTTVQLAGRTQLVVLARELLYRACELSANADDASFDKSADLYSQAARIILLLAHADLQRATSEVLAGTSDPAAEVQALENARKALEAAGAQPK